MNTINSFDQLTSARSAEVDLDDGEGTWIAKLGAEMIDEKGCRCVVKGWSDPSVWDDETGAYVPCAPGERYPIYRTLKVLWKDTNVIEHLHQANLRMADSRWAIPAPPLKILSYQEMLDLPDPLWLVEGLIMEETSVLLFGKSNSFKSFLAVDIACSIATAHLHQSWHGAEIYDGFPVLYVATEGGRGIAKQRIPGWYEAHQIPEKERNDVELYPQEIALDDDQAVTDLLRSCGIAGARREGDEDGWRECSFAYKLVVIDIFGASMMGPETSDETARAWVRNINRIMREMRCAVLTVAHTGWADTTRARMHTHFWGSFDTRLIAEGDKESLTTVLRVERHKDADSSGVWGFRLEKVEFDGGMTTLIPHLCDEIEQAQKRRVSGKAAVALQALSEALIDHGRTIAGPSYPSCPVVDLARWQTMCGKHGLTDSDKPDALKKAFQRAKTALINKGLVRQFDNVAWKVPDNE